MFFIGQGELQSVQSFDATRDFVLPRLIILPEACANILVNENYHATLLVFAIPFIHADFFLLRLLTQRVNKYSKCSCLKCSCQCYEMFFLLFFSVHSNNFN